MKTSPWIVAVVMGGVIAACFVPALEELDEERGRECNAEHACGEGASCVEGHCQPEEGSACKPGARVACDLDTGECEQGARVCGEDGKYGPCQGGVQTAAESCNGKDDDCDGQTDEGLACGDGGDGCEACTEAGRTCTQGECGGCLEGYFEQGKQCVPKKGLGEECSSQSMCASGSCADGVCCDSACQGPCEQCNQVAGRCTALADGHEGDPSCEPYRCGGSQGSCPVRCEGDGDCAEGVVCINNQCGDKLPLGGDCSRAAECASGYCVGGSCCGTAACAGAPGQCYQAEGTCSTGTCSYAPKVTGDSCDDGNACTVSDVCDGSGGCAGSPKACTAPPGQCYQPGGTCSDGTCNYMPKSTGTSCDDGNSCTVADVCNGSGTCAGNAMSCTSPPSQCHQPTGTCSNGACSYELKPSGATCDDSNSCTVADVCNSSGTCAGSTMSCTSPPSQCHQPTGTCSNGTCSYALKAVGSTCNDNNTCTTGDVCNSAGVCGGTDMTCNSPPDQCYQSAGTCSNGTCSYTPKSAGTTCNDGNSCTVADVCNGNGTCAGSTMSCTSPPSQCHQPTGTCSNGTCSYTLKPAGSACNDNNTCTTGDACSSTGACSGTVISCNSPPSQCYQPAGTCSNGSCSYTPKAAGSACDDGDACTINDQCNGSGVCVVTVLPCNTPPNQCYQSTGTCSNGTCSYAPKPSGSGCNDGNACTLGDVCNGSGNCGGVSTNSCDDANDCTLDSCNPSTGCSHSNKSYGAACGSDGRTCTSDICNGGGVCTHPQSCPANETCSPSGACQCSSPYTQCTDYGCTNLSTDVYNCGTCGRDCFELYGNPSPPENYLISCQNRSCQCVYVSLDGVVPKNLPPPCLVVFEPADASR